ncbi:MAG: tripeptide aminopeptidase PepT [Patescibacteria group bacterium]
MPEFSPVVERLLRYVKINTRSVEPKDDDENPPIPSSAGQIVLAHLLKEELEEMSAEACGQLTTYSDESFTLHVPATEGMKNQPHVVWAAHLDTSPEEPGKATPVIQEYTGGDVVLEHGGLKIPESDLEGLIGKHIIRTDGTSLLGVDDKGGVAALMTVIETLVKSPTPIQHGPLTFWFCVDEEIGNLDISILPREFVESWDILYTVDGGRVGEIDISCFTGRMVYLKFTGQNAHPAEAIGKLFPAHIAAAAFVTMLAEKPTPMETKDRESFQYAVNITGNASEANVMCIPRAFDPAESDRLVREIEQLAARAAQRWGVKVAIQDKRSYVDTRACIESQMHLVEPCVKAHKEFNIETEFTSVRGGTDGAMINMHFPNLAAPNIGTGGRNFHSRTEFCVLEELELMPNIIIATIQGFTQILALGPTDL